MTRTAQTVYQGARFRVEEIDLAQRSGGTAKRQIVVPNNAVVIVPVMTDGSLVLIRNQRFAVDQELWEIPAGTIEDGEAPDDCAARELVEESGYDAAKMEKLTAWYPTPGFCTEFQWVYRATALTHVGQQLDETEEIAVEVVSEADTLKMIQNGTIQDAKTIAGILFHLRFASLS